MPPDALWPVFFLPSLVMEDIILKDFRILTTS